MVRWRKLGIIAGGGELPLRIAAGQQAENAPFHIVRITGSAELIVDAFPGEDCAIGEVGKIIRSLKAHDCDAVVFAGVVRRPDFKTLKPDWRAAALMPKIIKAAAKGDGAILSVLVDTLEAEGLLVVGADEALESLAAPAGALGAHSPDEADFTDIKKAVGVIRALGQFDIGQGAVVANGFVLAIEAAEGTDAMLERCADIARANGIAECAGVLAKCPKPGQELRVDLPVIGVDTIAKLKAANLKGVGIEAGLALIIDRAEVIQRADEAGLFVYGFNETEIRDR